MQVAGIKRLAVVGLAALSVALSAGLAAPRSAAAADLESLAMRPRVSTTVNIPPHKHSVTQTTPSQPPELHNAHSNGAPNNDPFPSGIHPLCTPRCH
jgi:hypothetical protein